MYARIGDKIEVEGIRYKLCRENAQLVLKIDTASCIACHVNDAANQDANSGDYIDDHLCPACMTKAMQFTVIMDTLNHLADTDDELRDAIATWDEVDAKWRGKGQPYIERQSASWDYVRDEPELQSQMLGDWSKAILDVIQSGTLI
jgi:hypothetical protein